MARNPRAGDAERFEKNLEVISNFFAMDDPRSSFNRVMADLMECCPDAVIVGGIAVSFHVRNPRSTSVVDAALVDDDPLPEAFYQKFEPNPDEPFPFRHKETAIEVDLLTPQNPSVNQRLLAEVPRHGRWMERAGRQFRIGAPGMVIGLKLHRALKNTPEGFQDRADIAALLEDNPDLDLQPIRPHLSEEESDMLDDLLRNREPPVESDPV